MIILFIIRIIFTLMLVFMLLGLGMGALWLLKIRSHIQQSLNPRNHAPKNPSYERDPTIIEGEYKVIDEHKPND